MKSILKYILVFTPFIGLTQTYDYARSFSVERAGWYAFDVPQEVIYRTENRLNQVRILRITPNDTTQMPYDVDRRGDIVENERIDFEVLNEGSSNTTFQYDLHLLGQKSPNRIELNIPLGNYEYFVSVYGTNELGEWVLLKDSVRLLGWQDGNQSFQNTSIRLGKIEYEWLRLVYHDVDSRIDAGVQLWQRKQRAGLYDTMRVEIDSIRLEAQNSEVYFSTDEPILLAGLKVHAESSLPFHRRAWLTMKLENRKDVFYSAINGSATVLDSDATSWWRFDGFSSGANYQLIVSNGDSPALNYTSIEVLTERPRIVFYADEAGEYELRYHLVSGNPPSYDTFHFPDDSEEINLLDLGQARFLGEIDSGEEEGDQGWMLYAVLGVFVVVVAFTGVKMMKD